MKFAHMADMHFDTPFSSLNVKEGLGEKRRLEQRNAFRKAIDYILENDIEYLFIPGDLYENEYVRKSTIDFIKDQFARIPNTKIIIAPGNHDPYINGSYYSSYDFGKNVYVFSSSRIERIEDENVAIYGMAFTDFYMNESAFENFEIEDPGKLNILVAHCDLNGAKSGEGMGSAGGRRGLARIPEHAWYGRHRRRRRDGRSGEFQTEAGRQADVAQEGLLCYRGRDYL